VWEPLIAIADVAGGHWPATARAAASHFVGQAVGTGISVGTRLLADIRSLFARHGTDRMATTDIIGRLLDDEEASWADLDGRPLDARRLAREMSRYTVRPTTVRIGGQITKGYQAGGTNGLADAWTRYLPPPVTDDAPTEAPPGAVTAVTAVTSQVRGVTAKSDVTATSVTPPVEPPPPDPAEPGDVTATAVTPKSAVTGLTRHVTDVTAVTATDGGA
jgi:hypothetical protein